MSFWNPKTYNPQAQQFGQNLMAMGAAQPPATGIGGAIQNAMRMLVGGAMSGGQGRAQQRARGETMEGLQLAQAMKQETEQALAPQMMPGSGPMGMPNIGAQEVEVPAETGQEFQSRKLQAQIKALMSSEIPEYRMMGEQMMLKSLTEGPGEYKYFQGPRGKLTVVSPKNPTVPLVMQQGDKEAPTIKEIDPLKPHAVWDPETETMNYVPAADEAPDKYATTLTPLKNGNWGKFNLTSGEIEDSGMEMGEKPGTGVSVNVNLPGEPTKTMTTKLQEKALETSMGLKDMYGIYDRLEEHDESDEWFTYKGKGINFLRQLGEKMGVELDDEDLSKLENYADFQTSVWRMTNTYIQRITGAQVSAHEVKRLMNAIPNPGDSKTVFMAKLRYVTETTEMAHQAYMDALKGYGFSPHQWAAGQVPQDVQDQAEMSATALTKSRVDTYEAMSGREWRREGADRERSAKIRRRARNEENQRAIDAGETEDLIFEVSEPGS